MKSSANQFISKGIVIVTLLSVVMVPVAPKWEQWAFPLLGGLCGYVEWVYRRTR